MAAGFIWLHRDGHVRVPHFTESLLEDVLVRFQLMMRTYQVLCCHSKMASEDSVEKHELETAPLINP